MPKQPECRYCDMGFRPTKIGDDLICGSCGAEWNPVMVEDEVDEEDEDYNDPLFDSLE